MAGGSIGSSRRDIRECSMFSETPGHDRGQPAAQVLHPVGAGSAEPQPGFLHGIVRLARRAEHSVGDGPQMGPVLLEPFGQPVGFVHRSHSSVCRQSYQLTAAAPQV
jgi:hypothetical protein